MLPIAVRLQALAEIETSCCEALPSRGTDMPELPESDELVEQWRAGDQEAARLLFDRYVDRLAALARQRIGKRLSARVDADDVVQSVFRTFFCRLREGQYHIADQDDVCKLLVQITVHKTLRQVEFHGAGRRDPRQETPQGDQPQERLMELLGREPSPEATVTFLDQLEHFLNELRPEERQILEMRFQGHSNEEVAVKLGVSDRKVRRVIERVRGLAEQVELIPWMARSNGW
jgi:RNA polymerase sigma-70 factor (ECF subfamily)